MSENKNEALELADALNGKYGANYGANTSIFCTASDLIRRQHARIEELERVLQGFLSEFGDKATNANVKTARALLTKKD